MTDIEAIDIHELLPQQEPFVMVDRLTHFDMQRTVSQTTVKSDNILTDPSGIFSESGVIENIAQTCAARIGYVNKYILKKRIHIGFIGSIRNLRIHRLPKIGETIITTVVTVEEIFGMTLVKASVETNSGPIADAEMKIAVSEMEDIKKEKND